MTRPGKAWREAGESMQRAVLLWLRSYERFESADGSEASTLVREKDRAFSRRVAAAARAAIELLEEAAK